MRFPRRLIIAGALLAAACSDQPTLIEAPDAAGTDARSVAARSDMSLAGGYARTPAGWYHPSCVHEIPNGAHVSLDGRVTLPTGDTFDIPHCAHEATSTVPEPFQSALPTLEPTNTGWMEYAYTALSGGNQFRKLTAGWRVPAKPAATYTPGQVYYSFPGLQNSEYIIQPVLQYGNNYLFGGSYWTVASWRCNDGSDCLYGSPILAAPGDSIYGSIEGSACVNGVCTWTIVSVNVTSGARSSWTADDTGNYYWATGGAVEVYDLNSCSHYPRTGIFYSGVSLFDQSGTQISPAWSSWIDTAASPFCDFAVTHSLSNVNLYHNVPQLAVGVDGPDTGDAYEWVTMTANVFNGTAPYTYSWTKNGTPTCGNSSSCYGQLGAAGTYTEFAVTVVDANQNSATGAKVVQARWPDCPECM